MDIRIRISLLEIAKSAPWALELESALRAALKGNYLEKCIYEYALLNSVAKLQRLRSYSGQGRDYIRL